MKFLTARFPHTAPSETLSSPKLCLIYADRMHWSVTRNISLSINRHSLQDLNITEIYEFRSLIKYYANIVDLMNTCIFSQTPELIYLHRETQTHLHL